MSNIVIEKFKAFIAEIEADLKPAEQKAEAFVEAEWDAVKTFVENNGGQVAINLGKTVLLSLAAGTPWATIEAEFVAQATAAGIQLAEGAKTVVLNVAQSQLLAAGQAAAAPAPEAPAAQ